VASDTQACIIATYNNKTNEKKLPSFEMAQNGLVQIYTEKIAIGGTF